MEEDMIVMEAAAIVVEATVEKDMAFKREAEVLAMIWARKHTEIDQGREVDHGQDHEIDHGRVHDTDQETKDVGVDQRLVRAVGAIEEVDLGNHLLCSNQILLEARKLRREK